MLVYPQEKIRDDIIHLVNRSREGGRSGNIVSLSSHTNDIRRRNFHLFTEIIISTYLHMTHGPRKEKYKNTNPMNIFSNFFFVKHIRRGEMFCDPAAATDDKYVEGDINDAAGFFFTCVREI